MPKIFAELHNELLINHLNQQNQKYFTEKLVFTLTKTGYILPCSLTTKILPNLNKGIQIIGFLREAQLTNDDAETGQYDEMDEFIDYYIIYNADNGLLYGISDNCKADFGIIPQLVYGHPKNQFEFTIDSIFDNIMDPENYDSMKSALGFQTTINTRYLQRQFLIGGQEDDLIDATSYQRQESDFNDSNEQKHEEVIQNGHDTEVNEVYQDKINLRKTTVAVNLIEQYKFEKEQLKINVIKFYELNQLDVEAKEKGENQLQKDLGLETGATGDFEIQQVKQVDEEQKAENRASVKSEIQSYDQQQDSQYSSQAGNETNDQKLLREFKVVLADKSMPNSIKLVTYAGLFLFCCYLSLSIVQLVYKYEQEVNFSHGIDLNYYSSQRISLMAFISNQIRYLNYLSKGYIEPTEFQTLEEMETSYRNQMNDNIEDLQSTTMETMRQYVVMQQKLGDSANSASQKEYEIQIMNQDESLTITNLSYMDANFQFIAAAQALQNASFEELELEGINSVKKNFYFIMTNGKITLIVGGIDQSNEFESYFLDFVTQYQSQFVITACVAISFFVAGFAILIPFVVRVHKVNRQIMALFALIPGYSIQEEIDKIESYQKNYILDQ
eukprot:TRINITY_DN4257_c0_g1_i4.p1 TRINITY_DN4257_c0_g1~~TRINITY_DN4257_c0_g1_i4.p1  ORF type:complete len:613 (+),score=116.35 TRINITY_DN4257_c0_g1_i4:1233-3071(+)